MDIEHGGSAPTVSAVSFSLYSPSGEAIVDGATASESGGTLRERAARVAAELQLVTGW